MANTIPFHDWLRHLDSEYLSTFIKDGGASIKFAVTKDDLKPELYHAVESKGRGLGYLVVRLDAADIRVHMPQDIFFGMAKQVNWRHLARRFILSLAKECGYGVDDIDPGDAENIFKTIGRRNSGLNRVLDSEAVLRELRPELEAKVAQEYRMAKDFRVAMSHLCLRENVHPSQEYTAQPLIDWLTGEKTRISNVRPFSIYTAINRTTARHFLESALFWFKHVGYAGTVILLDNSRITLASDPKDGRRYYTKAMVMDHYEILREFVDGIDRLSGALPVILGRGNRICSHTWNIRLCRRVLCAAN